jgi:hypothetical protein
MAKTRTLNDILRVIMPVMNDWELFYVIVDDLAKKVYGSQREVRSIDFLLNLKDEDAQKLGRFFANEMVPCVEKGDDVSVFKDRWGGTIIRTVKADDQFDMMTIGRRLLQDYAYTTVYVASVEDLIFRELRADDRKAFSEGLELYAYWRNHLDMSYMVSTSRQMALYDKFIKMKKKGDARKL